MSKATLLVREFDEYIKIVEGGQASYGKARPTRENFWYCLDGKNAKEIYPEIGNDQYEGWWVV